MEAPSCDCFPKNKKPPKEPVPYYDHLGSGSSISDLRKQFEERWGFTDEELRFEKIFYTKNEGQTEEGCPLARWVLRRAKKKEKCLVVIKMRNGHSCGSTWIVVSIVVWEGVERKVANDLYTTFVSNIAQFSKPDPRGCESNKSGNCTCQGPNEATRGVSYSVGCSFNRFYNACKFANTRLINTNKFKIFKEEVPVIEGKIQELATTLAPKLELFAPKSYANQIEFESEGSECRLGNKPGRPWSGVTTCIDFSAHAHTDRTNMKNGCTTVVSLTKHRRLGVAEDEQLHVLPHYTLDCTDEFGSRKSAKILRSQRNVSSADLWGSEVGGVGISLGHGSLLFECAKNEVHATTALDRPDRFDPKRISLVFYQHHSLNLRLHGIEQHRRKMEAKEAEERLLKEEKEEVTPWHEITQLIYEEIRVLSIMRPDFKMQEKCEESPANGKEKVRKRPKKIPESARSKKQKTK